MKKIKEKLEIMYNNWKVIFPNKIFEEKRNGNLYINGWSFRYCFENINEKESMFIRAEHRMTDPNIFRIFENGEIESLTDFRNSDREHNIKTAKQLIEKGFNKYVINGIDLYIFIFDINIIPKNRNEIIEWYKEKVKWKEDHDYKNINISSNILINWYMEIVNEFPPMNDEIEDDDKFEEIKNNNCYTEYYIGKQFIYSIFTWTKAEKALEIVKILSKKFNVGFFVIEVYLEINDIIFPDGSII